MLEVKLGGEVKQLKFGNYALEVYTKLTGSDIGTIKEVGENYSELDCTTDVAYAGLVGNYRVKGKVVDFTIDDVREWIDDVDFQTQAQILTAFYNSILAKSENLLKQLEAMKGEAEKKN